MLFHFPNSKYGKKDERPGLGLAYTLLASLAIESITSALMYGELEAGFVTQRIEKLSCYHSVKSARENTGQKWNFQKEKKKAERGGASPTRCLEWNERRPRPRHTTGWSIRTSWTESRARRCIEADVEIEAGNSSHGRRAEKRASERPRAPLLLHLSPLLDLVFVQGIHAYHGFPTVISPQPHCSYFTILPASRLIPDAFRLFNGAAFFIPRRRGDHRCRRDGYVSARPRNQYELTVTTGIGNATTLVFAEAGCTKIAVTDLNPDLLNKTVSQVAEKHPSVHVYSEPGDVSDERFVESFISRVVDQYGRIDYCVNCAGILSKNENSTDMSIEDFDKVNNVNYRGCWLTSRAQLKAMLGQDPLPSHDEARPHQRGSIVNIASQLGVVGRPKARESLKPARLSRLLTYSSCLLRIKGRRHSHDPIRCHRLFRVWHPRELHLSWSHRDSNDDQHSRIGSEAEASNRYCPNEAHGQAIRGRRRRTLPLFDKGKLRARSCHACGWRVRFAKKQSPLVSWGFADRYLRYVIN